MRSIRSIAVVSAAGLLVGAGQVVTSGAAAARPHDAPPPSIEVTEPGESCAALTGDQIPASAFGLPTRGAVVTTALLKTAAVALPEYCEVQGSVLAANPQDPPINFQVNLPTVWNQKAVQFGGGGFNGRVVSGLGNVPHAPESSPTPLMRGYLTFGGDSGHQGGSGEFGMNAQALANYAGESVKRTHDVAVALSDAYYFSVPSRVYYAGGSKGGHEGLVAAQRYGADYDGVIAYYPANQNQAMVLSWFRIYQAAQQPGGSLSATEQGFLKTSVLATCDRLDGLTDGVIANLEGCEAAFEVKDLRCPDGVDTGDTCFSDAQINTLNTAASAMQFAFPLANGVTSIGPYPVFEGGDTLGMGLDGGPGAYIGFADPVIRYFIQQNPASTTVGFDYRDWQARVEQISHLYDATDPDLDTFRDAGGKLLLVQGTTDMLVTHTTTSEYYERLVDRYHGRLQSFARYYVQPGFGHGGGTYNMTWDSLSALEAWVESGQAPKDPVTVAGSRSMPLCEYPLWPEYKGRGEPTAAGSFRCVRN